MWRAPGAHVEPLWKGREGRFLPVLSLGGYFGYTASSAKSPLTA